MWLKVAIVVVGLLQLSDACSRRSSNQGTCKRIDHCDECPDPDVQCVACAVGQMMSPDRKKCVAVSACDGSTAFLTASEGTFGINKTQYVNNMDCSWKIKVKTSQIVKLNFLTFDVERANTCTKYDTLRVYDGVDNSAPSLATLCGQTVPGDIVSTNSYLFVHFKSDNSITRNGFQIKYTAILRTCDPNCDSCVKNGAGKCDTGECHDRYVFDSASKICKRCGYKCKSCDTSGPGNCDAFQCYEGYVFFSPSNICGVCDPHCSGCSEPGKCDSNKCLTGYGYKSTDKTCIACDAHCSKCVANEEGCDSGNCEHGYTLHATNKTCIPCAANCRVCNSKGPGNCDLGQCARRYAYDPNSNSCVACPVDCEECTYNTGLTQPECKECYGPRGVNSAKSCSDCVVNCHSCIVNGAGKCDPNQCYAGYTLDLTTSTCIACGPNCDSCATNGAGKCDTGKCHPRYGLDGATKTCKQCPDKCSMCEYVNNRAECTSCDDHFGLTTNDKTCAVCDTHCDGCATNGAWKCDPDKCHERYALDGASKTCKPCNSALENCYNCAFDAFVCVRCSSSYQRNSSTNECSGEMSSLLHGGLWVNTYMMTASLVAYFVSRPML